MPLTSGGEDDRVMPLCGKPSAGPGGWVPLMCGHCARAEGALLQGSHPPASGSRWKGVVLSPHSAHCIGRIVPGWTVSCEIVLLQYK